MKRLDELAEQIRAEVSVIEEAEIRIAPMIDDLNALRDANAAEVAKERFGVEVGMYIENRSDNHIILVRSFSADSLSKYSFEHGRAAELAASRIHANGARINKGSGKPMINTSYYRKGLEVVESVTLHENVKIIPPDQIKTTRERVAKSDAVKKLSSLSEEELQALLAAAGKVAS